MSGSAARAPVVVTLVFVLGVASTARADVREFLGRPLADVRVELGGQPFADPGVLELVQTRVGEPLRMEAVRETIDHLVGLGRFEDVRVFAEASTARADAVALRWVLAPLQRIGRIDIAGDSGLDRSAVRTELADRFGVRPSTARVPEMVEALRGYYSERGYRAPALQPRIVAGEVPELVTLLLTIQSGPRTTLDETTVNGQPPMPRGSVVAQLGLERGRPYDRPAIDARIARYEEQLRDLGHYDAAVETTVVFSEDGATAHLTVSIEPGPRVSIVFAGDPLPESRRDSLVPIRQERSLDLDLLEDASRNIEGFLRQQGYRAAQAPYTREARGSETVLTFNVSRGPLHRLLEVGLSGNSAIPLIDLANLMLLKPGEPFVDTRVATIASALTELYRVRGFPRAVVTPEITVLPARADNPDERPVAVLLVITEGLPTTVGSVTMAGAVEISETRIRPALALSAGRPFYRPQLDADRETIEQLYRNEGFQDVRVTGESTLVDEGRGINLHWAIREGPRTIVDHVLVSGNVDTRSDLIRREVVLQPGKPLGANAIVESQQRLAALGLFRRVRITELPHGASTNRDVLIEVEEAPSTAVSFGGGIEARRRLRQAESGGQANAEIEVAPRGFFEITRRNLWGQNRSISLFTRVSIRPRDPAIDSPDPTDTGGYGFNEYRVVGTFREPRPFDRPGEAQLTGFIEQAGRTSFNFRRRGVRAEYARRIGTSLTASGRYSFDHTRLFDEQIAPEDRLLVDRFFPQVRLSTFTASVLRDSRNDALDPQRGAVAGIDGSIAPRFAGSEVGFARTFLQGFIYRRMPGTNRVVVAAGARVGLAVGFARTVELIDTSGRPVIGPDARPTTVIVKDLPASERFFAGGDSTVRGFVLDQLGEDETLNDQGFPTGGNALIVLNLEMRTPYWKDLGGVAFFDAGNVFARVSHASFGDLRPAAGFGVRYRSPIGPLRIDLGFNVDRQRLRNGERERGTVFHISLGQAF